MAEQEPDPLALAVAAHDFVATTRSALAVTIQLHLLALGRAAEQMQVDDVEAAVLAGLEAAVRDGIERYNRGLSDEDHG
jgi:hypothetical protein